VCSKIFSDEDARRTRDYFNLLRTLETRVGPFLSRTQKRIDLQVYIIIGKLLLPSMQLIFCTSTLPLSAERRNMYCIVFHINSKLYIVLYESDLDIYEQLHVVLVYV
jgi:hypothetical protein